MPTMQLVGLAKDLENQGVVHPKTIYESIAELHNIEKFWYCMRSKDNTDLIAKMVSSPLEIIPFRINYTASCECMILYKNTKDDIPIVESYLNQTCTKRSLKDLADVLDLRKSFDDCDDFEKIVWFNVAIPIAYGDIKCPVKSKIKNPLLKDPKALLKKAHPEMFYDIFRVVIDIEPILTEDIENHD